MRHLIESIVIKDYDDANSIIEESFYYIIERKMIEKKKMIMAEKNAWNGMPSSRQEKLYRDVLEEDDLDEMDLSREKPDYDSIDDRRGQTPNAKAGQVWAKPHRKKMGVRVTQQQADDINSGKMSGGSPFSSLDNKIQKTTGLQVGGARPGMTGKNSPSGSSFFQKQFQKEESEEQLDEINLPTVNYQGGSGSSSVYTRSTKNPFSRGTEVLADKITQNVGGTTQTFKQKITANNLSNNTKAIKSSSSTSIIKEEEQLEEARIKLVKARIRGGKIERRKRVSNIPGMTLRGGQLKRMSAAERRRRKLGQRKAKLKRKAKMARTLMKRQRSLRRRKSLGI